MPIESVSDGDTTWGNEIRQVIARVNELEGTTTSSITAELSTKASVSTTNLLDNRLDVLESSASGGQLVSGVGNGTTDDGPAIRAQLAAASPGDVIYGIPGKTYLVGTPVTSTTFVVPSGQTTMPYILSIPSGVTLDLRGAKLKLKPGTDAVMVINSGALSATSTDTDNGLVNAVLDGSNVALTGKALVMWTRVTRPKMSVKILNGNHLGVQMYNIDHGDFPYLEADGFTGNPFSFGQKLPVGNDVRDCKFGSIRVRNVTPDPANTFNMPGNSLAGVFQRCSFSVIEARNCSAGIKIEEPSTDCVIDRVIGQSCGDSGGNSGLKLQGTSDTARVSRVSVGQVVMRGQTGHGLWMEYTDGCSVGEYIGTGNNTNGGTGDVWVGGKGDQIGSITSDKAGGDGVLVRTYAADVQIGKIRVTNPGQVTSSTSKVGMQVGGSGSVSIDDFLAADDQTTPTMQRGLAVYGTTALVRAPQVKIVNPIDTGIYVIAAGLVEKIILATVSGVTYGLVRVAGTALPASPPNYQKFTASGSFLTPDGITRVRVRAIGGGGGSGGAGSALTSGGVTTQAGSGGGGAGLATDAVVSVTPGTTYTVTIGSGGTAGVGGAVNGNAGTNGGAGGRSSFQSLVRADGGAGGSGSAANSVATVGGGMAGRVGSTSTSTDGIPGQGGPGRGSLGGVTASPVTPGMVGGGGGGGATATLGGGAGSASPSDFPAYAGQSGGNTGASANANGVDGVAPAATAYGCGASGAGGGAPGGTGGNGQVGAAGLVEVWW